MNDTPVFVSLARLQCRDQQDSELPLVDNEDDEPYVVVLTIDTAGSGLGIPGSGGMTTAELFQIGPLEDVDAGDIKPAPENLVWGLRGSADAMPQPDRVVMLVALLEHDNADPAKVAQSARSTLRAALAGLWINAQAMGSLSAQERFEVFVESAKTSFEQTLDLLRSIRPVDAVLDPDDLIGPAQVLRFSDEELQHVAADPRATVERTMRCQGEGASYDVTFVLWPAVRTLGDLLERLTGIRFGTVGAVVDPGRSRRPLSMREIVRSAR